MAEDRIQKVLARAGIASRRAAERLLAEGRISVNGIPVTRPGTKVDPARDAIHLDGAPIRRRTRSATVLALHKPPQVVTTLADPQGRPTVADLLRGDYKQSDYGKVILPFTVLRRLDCVLAETKPTVLAELAAKTQLGVNPEAFLKKATGRPFFNQSPLDLKKLLGDPANVAQNLFSYLQGFSPAVRDIFEHFEFQTQIERLSKAGLLYQVTEKFCQIDLHPNAAFSTPDKLKDKVAPCHLPTT